MGNNPNWANLATLKSPMYLNLKDADVSRDESLQLLGQMVTAEIIDFIDQPDLSVCTPPLVLQRACLRQCCYEWKQRATPGLTSVQMQDGSINKYQADEFLKEVKDVLMRWKRYALYEDFDFEEYEDGSCTGSYTYQDIAIKITPYPVSATLAASINTGLDAFFAGLGADISTTRADIKAAVDAVIGVTATQITTPASDPVSPAAGKTLRRGNVSFTSLA